MELLESVTPYLGIFRGLITKLSDVIAVAFDLNTSNIYIIIIGILSIWSAKYILEFFYTTLEGRKTYWIILAGVIFWLLKFVG